MYRRPTRRSGSGQPQHIKKFVQRYKAAAFPVRIFGFPRSGNHFLAASIALNFLNTSRWQGLFTPHVHAMPPKQKPTSKIIILSRDYEPMANSLFNIRDHFGLDCSHPCALETTSLSALYNPLLPSHVHFRGLYETKDVFTKDPLFSGHNELLRDFHARHKEAWYEYFLSSDNVMLLQYLLLKLNFESVIKQVSDFIGIPHREPIHFLNQRVGWCPPAAPKYVSKKGVK